MKKTVLILAIILIAFSTKPVFSACPPADLTGDCKVDFKDFALMISQWLDEGIVPDPCSIVWVDYDDPGIDVNGPFSGQMSKHEITNEQYCEYLNATLAFDEIAVDANFVCGTRYGFYNGRVYYNLGGSGYTYNGATKGGAARIKWDENSFTVDNGFEEHPVTYVSWYGATAFCTYYGYRLPTEWEWCAVADYDGSFTYGCGTSISNYIANYRDSNHPEGTNVVGSFAMYGYGMSDMAGNVWEWTSSSCYGDWTSVCGGAWSDGEFECRLPPSFLDCVTAYTTDSMTYNIGFRVCR